MKKAVVIGGPTASGKSSLAVSLAKALNGVVINADSLQIYDALPLLTAQPDATERAAVPHKLYGIAHPNQTFTAQSWREAAVQAMAAAVGAGQTPIIVGGTGFYINALLQGMSAIPEIPAAARDEATQFFHTAGREALLARLSEADPAGTARLDAQNPQRLIRAYEVLLHTGQPISYWQAQPRQGPPAGWQFFTVALLPARDDLHRNCAARIEMMRDQGLYKEVELFDDRVQRGDVAATAPVTHACGYTPLSAFLRGALSEDEALAAMLADTRQYARRQDTWFRRQWAPDAVLTSARDAPMDAIRNFMAG